MSKRINKAKKRDRVSTDAAQTFFLQMVEQESVDKIKEYHSWFKSLLEDPKKPMFKGPFHDHVIKNKNINPVCVAYNRKDPEIFYQLLLFKPDIHAKDRQNSTVLHWAVKLNHVKSVAFLLYHGADPNCANHMGERPIDLMSNPQMLQLVLDFKQLPLQEFGEKYLIPQQDHAIFPYSVLPRELQYEILTKLPIGALSKAPLVCRMWRDYATEEKVMSSVPVTPGYYSDGDQDLTVGYFPSVYHFYLTNLPSKPSRPVLNDVNDSDYTRIYESVDWALDSLKRTVVEVDIDRLKELVLGDHDIYWWELLEDYTNEYFMFVKLDDDFGMSVALKQYC